MSVRKPLTARGVKAMLTRAGVDHSELTFTETVDHASVIIHGPHERRRRAFHALLDRGLSVAPFPDKDWWSR